MRMRSAARAPPETSGQVVGNTASTRRGSRETIALASYNVHSCVGMDRRRKPSRIAQVIREVAPDIIALQEVDNQPGDDVESMQLEYLSDVLEMAAIPGLRMIRQTGEYGNAILTRYPILAVRRHDLSYPLCEPRGAIDVHLDVHGNAVRVIAAHLGLRRAERQFQWRRVLDAVATEREMPTFVLGDMNEWYRGSRTLKEAHRMFGEPPAPAAFPSFFPVLALTRIWVRPPQAIIAIETHRSRLAKVASDHLPLKAKIDVARLAVGSCRRQESLSEGGR